MTLTDIISKVTRYAKKVIVTDNSSTSAAVNIVQAGSGDGLTITSYVGSGASIQAGSGDGLTITSNTGSGASIKTITGTTLKLQQQQNSTNPPQGGTLEFFKSSGGDMVFDGANDGVFTFVNTSLLPTKATSFIGANFGVGTINPSEALDVDGKIKSKNEVIVNGSNQTFKFLAFNTDSFSRWHIGATDDNESGANAGSDFFIHRFSDTGAFLSWVIQIKRDTGIISVVGLPVYANNAAALAGGLVINNVYKTAAGELQIVV
jgi:hypothetical protein